MHRSSKIFPNAFTALHTIYANKFDMAKDLYSVLDINAETNKAEIRQAYMRLARQYHPDINKNPHARERFEEITLAYKILSDEETRIIYNLYRKNPQHLSKCQEPLPWWQQYKLVLDVIGPMPRYVQIAQYDL